MANKKKKKISKNRRVTKDGKVWYYYRKKRKPGPKKKRGPKKKKKTEWIRRFFLPWNFKIIICSNKKQSKCIKRYHNEEEVLKAKEELIENNNKVIIPIERTNNGRENNKIEYVDLEYLILKKVSDDSHESNLSILPNKYGKLVQHKTNKEEWVIWDKFPCLKEEEFWVFGYNKKNERKTVFWIFENLILPKIECKYDFLRIVLYNNKLVIIDDNDKIDIIICKNTSDGIRLYNTLSKKFCVGFKNIIFRGKCEKGSDLQKKVIKLIEDKTKWKKKDIYRASTRH